MQKIYYENISVIEIEDESVFTILLNRVNELRRKKVLLCKQQKDRQRSLLAGLLLRQMIEEEGLDYEGLEFAVSEDGKPYLVSQPQIQFSISHAGDYVVCAISDEPIGVDIESMKKSIFREEKEHHLNIMAKKCLASLEWENFSKNSAKSRIFLEYWTRKEAYSKYMGKGLRMDFAAIDTELHKQGFCTVWINDEYCISIYCGSMVKSYPAKMQAGMGRNSE